MAKIVNGLCMCETCAEDREALQKQLEHPFYKRAEEFRNGVKMETMEKAAKKYKEPFNPASWTSEELAKHAMAENYDQENYIFGLYEALKASEQKAVMLKDRIQRACVIMENELDKQKIIDDVYIILKGLEVDTIENE
jgi:hypothetical protein